MANPRNLSVDSYERDFLSAGYSENARATFLKKVYLHVLGAVLLMAGIIAAICNVPSIGNAMMGLLGNAWMFVLIGFVAVTFIAQKMAYSQTSRGVQYAGLGLYVLAQSVIISPLVFYVTHPQMGLPNGGEIVMQAALITGLIFGGLTAVVYITGADFSFLRGFITIAGFAAMGLIFASFFFGGLTLGTWFSVAIIGLMALTILYETSVIRDQFPPDAYVAAALALFGSISTLFFYVLRLLLAFASED